MLKTRAKRTRQEKARNVMRICAIRMTEKIFRLAPGSVDRSVFCRETNGKPGVNLDLCDQMFEAYLLTEENPDRLTRAYELASIVA